MKRPWGANDFTYCQHCHRQVRYRDLLQTITRGPLCEFCAIEGALRAVLRGLEEERDQRIRALAEKNGHV